MPEQITPVELDVGQNRILQRGQIDLAPQAEVALTYSLPPGEAKYKIVYVTGHRDPPVPYVPVRVTSLKIFRAGESRAEELIDGEPFWEEVIGTAQLPFLLAKKELVGGNVIEMKVKSTEAPGGNNITVSITLIGEIIRKQGRG